MPTGSEIRAKFLKFFEKKGHKIVHSSSLVPQNDPTLLFTNAGMNQFKDFFLGLRKSEYPTATTSQKCVRAGGKHNDLENVGFTNRHHTFFEMLGNFSFGEFSGGYYKEEAIHFAWELLTLPEWFGIAPEKLYFTIFGGATIETPSKTTVIAPDGLSQRTWEKAGAPPGHVKPLAGEEGLRDNFWQMGDTGPCGSCSEIFYDMGLAASDKLKPKCASGECPFPCDCGRYVEIWNLVFMQWDRDSSGNLNPLPEKCVDTGMGLERLAAVLQGVVSNYETDLFTPLIQRAAELCKVEVPQPVLFEKKPAEKVEADQAKYRIYHLLKNPSLRVIADHSRAATFLVADGVIPGKGKREYVLRKIIRRGIRHGRLLGAAGKFMGEMTGAVCDLMGGAYTELLENRRRIFEIVEVEEARFQRTLAVAMSKLDDDLLRTVSQVALQDSQSGETPEHMIRITALAQDPNAFISAYGWGSVREILSRLRVRGTIPTYAGVQAFRLYDTFGLPIDFIQDACRDLGIRFDQGEFEVAMEEQKNRARASWKGAVKQTANPAYQQLPKSIFEGYRQTRSENCEVLAIIKDSQGVQQLNPGDSGEVILDHTPFYAESGGQVGDRGWFYSDDHNTLVAEVTGCYAPIQGVRAHQVTVKHSLRVGQKVDAVVNADVREATMRNHTATHLLHAGLREVLGKHVKQAGSLVAPNHLRFDFSHFTGVEDEELQDIEDIINKQVLRNIKVETITDVPIDDAINKYHAMALFGEKYGDKVRVVKIGDFSTELCGGTHTAATGEIGLIKVLKEGSVSSGVRRIEAVTGEGSLYHFRKDHALEHVVASLSNKEHDSPADALRAEIERRDAEIKRLTRDLDQARMKSAASSVASATGNVKEVRGVKVLAHRVDNLERAQLRTLIDQLRDKLGSGVVVVGSASNGNVSLIAGVTKDLTSRVQAGKIVGAVAERVGGKGGGRPDLAEAGGKNPEALDSALADVYKIVESLL
jgi:alanyl-tRNA synthetase